jgi:hypothetical protein
MSGQTFDPKRSTVQDDKLAEFVNLQLSGDLKEVRHSLTHSLT